MIQSEWEEYTDVIYRVPWEDSGRIENPLPMTAGDCDRLLFAVGYASCVNLDFLFDAERMGYDREQLWDLVPYIGRREQILHRLATELREYHCVLFLSSERLELLYFAYAAAEQRIRGQLHRWKYVRPERDFEGQKDKLTAFYRQELERLAELKMQILKMEEYCYEKANTRCCSF